MILMSKKKPDPVKFYKLRGRFAAGFFATITVFMGTLFVILYCLEHHGIAVNGIKNPLVGSVIVGILCIVLSFVAAYFMMRMISRPLERMSYASRKVAGGDYTIQLEYGGDIEELQTTIQNFNLMVRELNSVEMIRKDFIANVSHEFKTPLSSVMGYVMLLQDPELTQSERDDYIQRVIFNINKLNDLTDNILRISKLENQNSLENGVAYRLDEQIREAIVLLEPRWSKKQINLDIDLQQMVWTGQKELFFQVWLNLISNAIKFTDEQGEIMIRMKRYGRQIRVSIVDNGIGMSQETQKHIFDKFYQGDTSRRSQGNGLGLALCKEILNKCGAKIYVTSEEGKGSVFMVVLDGEGKSGDTD